MTNSWRFELFKENEDVPFHSINWHNDVFDMNSEAEIQVAMADERVDRIMIQRERTT